MSSRDTGGSTAEEQSGQTTVETVDWNDKDGAALTIVETVASVQERDPTELDPLSSIVDPDALNTLFASTEAETSGALIQFEYENCLVSVTADGNISVAPAEQ